MIRKKLDFSEVCLCGKLCVKLHSVAVKDMSCTIRLLAKFELSARASNKTRLKYSPGAICWIVEQVTQTTKFYTEIS